MFFLLRARYAAMAFSTRTLSLAWKSLRKPSFSSTSMSTKMGAMKMLWNRLSKTAGLRPSCTPAQKLRASGRGGTEQCRLTVTIHLNTPANDVHQQSYVPNSGQWGSGGCCECGSKQVRSIHHAPDHGCSQGTQEWLAISQAEVDVKEHVHGTWHKRCIVSNNTKQGEALRNVWSNGCYNASCTHKSNNSRSASCALRNNSKFNVRTKDSMTIALQKINGTKIT